MLIIHTVISLLASEHALVEDGAVVVAGDDGVEEVVGFGALGLGDLVGSALEGDEDHAGEDLLEAGMLAVGEPGVAE